MNQAELRKFAEERILDAKALLESRRWAFAYYVAGYAVEFALKSCVLAQMVHTGGVFKNKKFAEECFTHDLGKLAELAGLAPELGKACQANSILAGNWGTTKDWKETSRYEPRKQADEERLFEAISNDPNGVLPWFRVRW